MVTFDEAQQKTMQLAATRKQTTLDLWTAPSTSAYLAAPVMSTIDFPNFDRAMMDGYAIHIDDISNTEQTLNVIGDIRAGDNTQTVLRAGCAVKVRTGAPAPSGTAAVVRQEWIDQVGPNSVRIARPVKPEESVQRRGEDVMMGDLLLSRGSKLNGGSRAVLKAAGVRNVQIYAPCRVVLLCTGSELVHEARNLRHGEVYAANDTFLADSLYALGATVVNTIFVEDNLSSIIRAVDQWIDHTDYLLITGGASVGDTDFVKEALRSLSSEATLPIERVWMRPGSPFIATRLSQTTVFAMSGNPAACFVQFHALARHAIEWSLGLSPQPFSTEIILGSDLAVKPVKHVRLYRAAVRLEEARLVAQPQAKQSSGSMTGLSTTNGLIRLDKHVYHAGDVVRIEFTTRGECDITL